MLSTKSSRRRRRAVTAVFPVGGKLLCRPSLPLSSLLRQSPEPAAGPEEGGGPASVTAAPDPPTAAAETTRRGRGPWTALFLLAPTDACLPTSDARTSDSAPAPRGDGGFSSRPSARAPRHALTASAMMMPRAVVPTARGRTEVSCGYHNPAPCHCVSKSSRPRRKRTL
jgi:hypothetical protein